MLNRIIITGALLAALPLAMVYAQTAKLERTKGACPGCIKTVMR